MWDFVKGDIASKKKILAVICSVALCMSGISPALAVEKLNYEEASSEDINLAQVLADPENLVQELAVSYRNPLYSRETADDDVAGIFNKVLAHTGNTEEGDYLRWHYEQMGVSAFTYSIQGQDYDYLHEITFEMTYCTNASQEAIFADKVAEVVGELNIASIEADYLTTSFQSTYPMPR